MTRTLTYAAALLEAQDQCMEADPTVYLIGLGVPDPKGIFGTTTGLAEKHGSHRVLDMPTSENAMTGMALGSSLMGLRPILTHQRFDFALLSMDQLVTQAAKWHYMFGGKANAPMVIRLVVGRGWGQGPQHSQCLHNWLGHVPGLKVLMPTTPYDAKGMLIAAVRDENPVVIIEHRWLHNITGPVPEEAYAEPLGKARIARQGTDLTIVSTSYMTLEALRAAEALELAGISVEVVDVRCIRPFDRETVLASVRKTGRLLVADIGWTTAGFSGEVMATVTEAAFDALRCAPARIALPDVPSPSAPALSQHYYPRAMDILRQACTMVGVEVTAEAQAKATAQAPFDVPDKSFTGPF